MSHSSPEGIILGKGSTLQSLELSINKEKVINIKQEKKFSEEDLREAYKAENEGWISFESWFEQFKKK